MTLSADFIFRFYFDAKANSVDKLKDGAGNKPHYRYWSTDFTPCMSRMT